MKDGAGLRAGCSLSAAEEMQLPTAVGLHTRLGLRAALLDLKDHTSAAGQGAPGLQLPHKRSHMSAEGKQDTA